MRDGPSPLHRLKCDALPACVQIQPYLLCAVSASAGCEQGGLTRINSCPAPAGRAGQGAASAAQPDPPQPAYLGHPAFRQAVGRDRGRYALGAGEREDLPGCAEDLLRPGLGPLEVEPAPLIVDLEATT